MLYLLIPSLLAFAPNPNQGIEPQRIYPSSNYTYQRHLEQQIFWQQFLHDSNSSWNVRFDETTGYPLRATGKGISFGNDFTEKNILEKSNSFVAQHKELFHPKNLSEPQITYNNTRHAYFVHYDQKANLKTPIYDDIHNKHISFAKVF